MSSTLAQVGWQTLVASGVVLGLLAIVALIMRSIVKGDLVPRQHLVDVRSDRDKWESAWKLSQDTMAELDGRLDANTEALQLMQRLVEALATKGPAR